jgi:hypothetical protein
LRVRKNGNLIALEFVKRRKKGDGRQRPVYRRIKIRTVTAASIRIETRNPPGKRITLIPFFDEGSVGGALFFPLTA